MPIDIAEQRDVKGLFAEARAGKIKNLAGVNSLDEVPERAEMVLKANEVSAEKLAERLVQQVIAAARMTSPVQ